MSSPLRDGRLHLPVAPLVPCPARHWDKHRFKTARLSHGTSCGDGSRGERLRRLCALRGWSSFGARPWRRARVAQDRRENRDRRRILDTLRETIFNAGAPRVVRASLPDRGYLLIAHGLPCVATVCAGPVRPSRCPCRRVTCRRAREARDGTILGTITHGEGSSGLRARQRPPLTRSARPASACCRRCR
jgi:hypothetical protein